ncbi:MAG: ATPase [Mesorhizobium sp.]|uniref:SRPBCC domain-containing protein n=1 Tax=Mesorhizobium sp. TaxID=1871066 RepID=UPI000FE7D02A|nr:SRPBCC domain-containing protein [Mesorhizobium sp.]RWA69424.1 MAG: ATPase [Mesorhizobium sp.]RWC03048.1 MAG: ATPase [Mesorhizobium sp.]
MASNDRPRAIADVSAGTILATVTIAVPPERVFRAITAEDQVPLWWGADDMYRTTKHTADVRPGGTWRSEGKGADGHEFHVGGEYIEVEPPRRLVMTWKAPWDGDHVTTVIYTLEAVENGTRLTLRHDGFGARHDSCRDHGSGWERVLGWLGDFLAKEIGARPPSVFHCRLIPPRPDFAFTMSEEERALMNAHADYLRGRLRDGTMMLAGPVADPAGPWGLLILRAGSEAEARAVTDGDPVARSGRGFRYEILPMMSTIM